MGALSFRSWGGEEHGFTLVELVTVIAILGVISATVVMKWPTGMNLATSSQQLIQDLRYTQSLAMNRGSGYKLVWVDQNTYRILTPASAELTRADVSGVTLTSNYPGVSVTFNGLGQPTGGSVTMTLYDGSGSQTVTVSAETGMVQ
jgi:prepilin-type N-terminal cleavage/methylation domain-containing protein